MRFCVPGFVAAAAAGVLSTTAMIVLRHIEGRPVLSGPPHGHLYEACIALGPFLLVTALIPIAWARSIWRSARGDRFAVACLTAGPLVGAWVAAVLWIFSNTDRAFP
jgi:hypothetical protein